MVESDRFRNRNNIERLSMKNRYFNHVEKCLKLLSKKARIFYFILLFAQVCIASLDLIGLALIMQIVVGMQASSSNVGNISSVFSFSLSEFIRESKPEFLLMCIVLIFVFKGFIAIRLHTLNVKLVARETSQLMLRLIKRLTSARTTEYKKLSIQEISYILYNSTEMVFRETLVPFSIIIADVVLLALISLNLLLNAPSLFIPTVLYFSSIFIYLRFRENRNTSQAYKVQLEGEIRSRQIVIETFSSLRELYTSNKLPDFINKISVVRNKGINAGSVISIAQLRPKYFYEMALFGGLGLITVVSHTGSNQGLLIAYLTFFLVSSSRAIPSLLRIQYYLGIFNKAAKQSKQIFEVLELDKIEAAAIKNERDSKNVMPINRKFTPEISMSEVSFSYSASGEKRLINQLTLNVAPGEMIAIVGPSGAGKSTIVDLLLGYLKPDRGSILISGESPRDCFEIWDGKVAYVPQKVTIYEDTLYSNVSLEFSEKVSEVKIRKVSDILELVGLGEYVRKLPNGIHSQMSESGSSLSGGQIQRIGIARALFSDPEVIIFDESTSSLDSLSESSIMELITSYKHSKTIILIAHRLSTIRSADRIIYFDDGKIKGSGTFDALRSLVPEFEVQVMRQNLDS